MTTWEMEWYQITPAAPWSPRCAHSTTVHYISAPSIGTAPIPTLFLIGGHAGTIRLSQSIQFLKNPTMVIIFTLGTIVVLFIFITI